MNGSGNSDRFEEILDDDETTTTTATATATATAKPAEESVAVDDPDVEKCCVIAIVVKRYMHVVSDVQYKFSSLTGAYVFDNEKHARASFDRIDRTHDEPETEYMIVPVANLDRKTYSLKKTPASLAPV